MTRFLICLLAMTAWIGWYASWLSTGEIFICWCVLICADSILDKLKDILFVVENKGILSGVEDNKHES